MRAMAQTMFLFALFLLPSVIFGQAPETAPPRPSEDFGLNVSVSQLLTTAQTNLRSGDLPHAVSALRQAVDMDERNKTARKTLIQTLLLQGNLKEAEEQVQTYGRLHPEESDAMF